MIIRGSFLPDGLLHLQHLTSLTPHCVGSEHAGESITAASQAAAAVQLQGLRQLNLRHTNLTDANMQGLSNLTSLTNLGLRGDGFTGSCLPGLTNLCTKLRELSLVGCSLSLLEGLEGEVTAGKWLTSCSGLMRLHLGEGHVQSSLLGVKNHLRWLELDNVEPEPGPLPWRQPPVG